MFVVNALAFEKAAEAATTNLSKLTLQGSSALGQKFLGVRRRRRKRAKPFQNRRCFAAKQ